MKTNEKIKKIVVKGETSIIKKEFNGYMTALPPDIHFINIRESYPEVWKKISSCIRNRADWKCQNCGRDFSNETYNLHSHEMWLLDYDHKIAEIIDIKALCHICHQFYHQGLYGIKRMSGEINNEQARIIEDHWEKYPQKGYDIIISEKNKRIAKTIFNSEGWTVKPFDNIICEILNTV